MKTLLDSLSDKIKAGDGCWNWYGYLNIREYGQLTFQGKSKFAHRIMYELLVGPIPEGLTLDHLCRNTRCVKPNHLEPVTNKVNIQRSNLFRSYYPK